MIAFANHEKYSTAGLVLMIIAQVLWMPCSRAARASAAERVLHRCRQERAQHCQVDDGEGAARLDRDTFGVDGAHGPWQQRLAEIGGIKPLAFGQFGEMGPGLEVLLASVASETGGGRDGGSISDRKPRGSGRSAGVPLAAALGSHNLEGANI
jgi:hypothetical protein